MINQVKSVLNVSSCTVVSLMLANCKKSEIKRVYSLMNLPSTKEDSLLGLTTSEHSKDVWLKVFK